MPAPTTSALRPLFSSATGPVLNRVNPLLFLLKSSSHSSSLHSFVSPLSYARPRNAPLVPLSYSATLFRYFTSSPHAKKYCFPSSTSLTLSPLFSSSISATEFALSFKDLTLNSTRIPFPCISISPPSSTSGLLFSSAQLLSTIRTSIHFARMSTAASYTEHVTDASVSEVKGRVYENGLAVITLDRPKALNAMNLDMDRAFTSLLDLWAKDESVKVVVVEGSTARAFSSGADVKWMTIEGKKLYGMHGVAVKVFSTEYSLICRIAKFPKPYISLMDGITMGFGLGVSAHGRHRVVTERSVLAMPENAIGLFPDVGFSLLAARTPEKGAIGLYMGLTGARLSSPNDCIFSSLATHFVPSTKLPVLKEELQKADFSSSPPDAAVASFLSLFSEPPPSPENSSDLKIPSLQELSPLIGRCFGSSIPVVRSKEMLEKEAESSDAKVAEWAKLSLQGLSKGSPFSLALTHHYFGHVAASHWTADGERISKTAANPEDDLTTIDGVMRLEYRVALRASNRGDFTEGVRAVLVDKDQKPRWSPPSLEAVDEEEVKSQLEAFGKSELEFNGNEK